MGLVKLQVAILCLLKNTQECLALLDTGKAKKMESLFVVMSNHSERHTGKSFICPMSKLDLKTKNNAAFIEE